MWLGGRKQHCLAERQLPLAYFAHLIFQKLNPLRKPFEFLCRDLVVRRVTSIDVGTAQQLKGSLRKARITRPDLDEIGRMTFRL